MQMSGKCHASHLSSPAQLENNSVREMWGSDWMNAAVLLKPDSNVCRANTKLGNRNICSESAPASCFYLSQCPLVWVCNYCSSLIFNLPVAMCNHGDCVCTGGLWGHLCRQVAEMDAAQNAASSVWLIIIESICGVGVGGDYSNNWFVHSKSNTLLRESHTMVWYCRELKTFLTDCS